MEEVINPSVKSVKMQVTSIVTASCYYNIGLPLHRECPYGKTQVDTNCQICCRHNKKSVVIETKAVEE